MKKHLYIIMTMAAFTVQTGNAGNAQPHQRTWAEWAQQQAGSATQVLQKAPGFGNVVQDANMLMAKAKEAMEMGREAAKLAAQIQELIQRAEASLQEIGRISQKWGVSNV